MARKIVREDRVQAMKQTSTAGMKYPLPSPTCSARYSSTRPGSGLRSKRPLSAASSVGAWVLAAALRSEAVGLLGPVDSRPPPKRRFKKPEKKERQQLERLAAKHPAARCGVRTHMHRCRGGSDPPLQGERS